jgi:hypothetical protein
MKKDSLSAEIEHRIAELCAAHRRIIHCGPACASAEEAVEAAFAKATSLLTAHA